MNIYDIKLFFKKNKVTSVILTIILAYFLIMTWDGGTTNSETLIKYGAFFPPFILAFNEYYRFISSIFIHIGLSHIFFNSYALYIFGPQIEYLMGGPKFLAFFLLTGISGNILTFFLNFESLSAGASGSLFGILGAFFYLIRKHPNMITAAGRRNILYMLGVNLLLTFLVPKISITAHLGGFIAGYFLSYFFIK